MHNYFRFKEFLTRELFEIYFLLGLRNFALYMIGIFIPIFFYSELSYSIPYIAFFYLLLFLSVVISLPFSAKVISKFGTKHSMMFSVPIIVIGYLFLLFIGSNPLYFYFAAFFLGAELAFFWPAFHIDAALHGRKKSTGKKSALIFAISLFPSIIGPLIGALTINYLGFTTLFIIAILLLIISSIPLFISRETFAKTDFQIKDFFVKDHLKFFFEYFAEGINSMVKGVFWPLFIFLILGGYISLGIYATFTGIIITAIILLFGEISDEGKKKYLLIKISAFSKTILATLMFFVTSVFQVYFVGTLNSIATYGISIPMLAKSYKQAKKEKTMEFILFRELSLIAGRIFVILLVMVFASLKISFLATGITYIFFLFI